MKITSQEIEELERFKERREAFGGDLSIKNVHNVPKQFPNLYKKIFKTESLENGLFCTSCPNYSDADENIVQIYENYLKEDAKNDR